jgi:hypothetical protein
LFVDDVNEDDDNDRDVVARRTRERKESSKVTGSCETQDETEGVGGE